MTCWLWMMCSRTVKEFVACGHEQNVVENRAAIFHLLMREQLLCKVSKSLAAHVHYLLNKLG